MDDVLDLRVSATEAGERLDHFLARHVPGLSHARARALVATGAVTVDGHTLRKGDRVREGQRVRMASGPIRSSGDPERTLPLATVVHEDAHLVVVDKPAGLPTHGDSADARGTLAAQLLARFPE